MVFMGNVSYAMYILHAPLYTWLMIFFRRILKQPPQGWLWFGSYLAVVLAISCAFYAFIEEPVHLALRARFSGRLRPAPPVAG